MPAYAIVRYRVIHDTTKLLDYGRLAYPTLKAFGAIPRVVNAPAIALEGGEVPSVVLLEFADIATARAWYDSPEYQAAADVRKQAAEVDFLLVDGVPPRSPSAG